MLKLFPQIVIAACGIFYTIVYVKGIKQGTVKPILATRIFLLLALFLSLLTNYEQTGIHGLSASTLNIMDLFSVLLTFFATIFNKNIRRKFTKFEIVCLSAVIFVFLIWIISRQNILANISIQIILVIAYLPTIIHLWKSKENTESLGAWLFDLLASFMGTVEPLRTMDLLPLIYGIRSTLSVSIVIILILRIQLRKEKIILSYSPSV